MPTFDRDQVAYGIDPCDGATFSERQNLCEDANNYAALFFGSAERYFIDSRDEDNHSQRARTACFRGTHK